MEKKVRSKTSFTRSELVRIEKLISEKLNASSDKQKSIRADIRKIGFYWSDFVEESHQVRPYNVENFRALIKELVESGQIKVVED
jgi:hypothetical protein